jgi:hypothetical protein
MFGRRRRCMICMRICCMERIDRRPAPSSCSRGGGLRAARACSIVYRPASQQSSEALFKCVWYESFSSGACRQARQGKAAGRQGKARQQAGRQHPTHTQQAMDDPAGQRNYYSPDRSIGCAWNLLGFSAAPALASFTYHHGIILPLPALPCPALPRPPW